MPRLLLLLMMMWCARCLFVASFRSHLSLPIPTHLPLRRVPLPSQQQMPDATVSMPWDAEQQHFHASRANHRLRRPSGLTGLEGTPLAGGAGAGPSMLLRQRSLTRVATIVRRGSVVDVGLALPAAATEGIPVTLPDETPDDETRAAERANARPATPHYTRKVHTPRVPQGFAKDGEYWFG